MQAIEELFSPPVYASPAAPRPPILRVKSFSQARDDLMGNDTIDIEDDKEVTYVRGAGVHVGAVSVGCWVMGVGPAQPGFMS